MQQLTLMSRADVGHCLAASMTPADASTMPVQLFMSFPGSATVSHQSLQALDSVNQAFPRDRL